MVLRILGGKRRGLRNVSQQVEALFFVENALHAGRNVVDVVDEQSSGFIGEHVRAGFVGRPLAAQARHRLARWRRPGFRGARGVGAQAAEVDAVYDHPGAIREIGHRLHHAEDTPVARVGVRQAEAVGEEQQRLAAGELRHAAQDVEHRAERAGGEEFFLYGVEPCVGVGGGERGHRRDPVPLHTIGGRVQLALVGRELLQRPDSRARPQYGDQVTRLHLRVDVPLQRAIHVVDALERQSEIVDDHGDRPSDLFWRRAPGTGRSGQGGGR